VRYEMKSRITISIVVDDELVNKTVEAVRKVVHALRLNLSVQVEKLCSSN
jgi:nitrogen regulatory protein PII